MSKKRCHNGLDDTRSSLSPQPPEKRHSLEVDDTVKTSEHSARASVNAQLALSQYEILTTVLSQLAARGLCRLRSVSALWRHTIDRILAARAGGTRALLSEHCYWLPSADKRTESCDIFDALVARVLDVCPVRPHLVLAVCSPPLTLSPSTTAESATANCSRLPSDCALLRFDSHSGCMTTDATGTVHELQQPFPPRALCALLVLPSISGALVGQCSLRPQRNIEQLLQRSLPPGALDCLHGALLLFSDPMSMRCARRLARYLWTARCGRIALAGGWVDQCVDRSGRRRALQLVYFGGAAVSAASVVVGDDKCVSPGCLARDQVLDGDAGARLLAAERRVGWRAMAFVSACCGRGKHLHHHQQQEEEQQQQLETDPVRHHLGADVPVLGVFVNGEVGSTWLPARASADHESRPLQPNTDILLQYTTVVLLVQFAS